MQVTPMIVRFSDNAKVEGPETLPKESSPRRFGMQKGNILIVDDEKLIRWSLKEFLGQQGFAVTAVEDGRSALKATEEEIFDAVLLDYKLPDTNGLEVLQRIHAREPDLPVVMITSHSSVENAVAAMKAGASDYVTKPFRNDDIGHRVEK